MSRSPAGCTRSLIEPLENRIQLTSTAAAPFSVRINFTTETAPGVTSYKRDFGAVYTHHNNGLTYGWNHDVTGRATYQRAADRNAKLDSNIALDPTDKWEISVPTGYYTVHAIMGQPGVVSGDQRLMAEGSLFVRGEPDNGYSFIEGYGTVAVTDGRLTLATNSRAIDPRLICVEITQVPAPKPTPTTTPIAWSTTTLNVPVARVEFSTVRTGTKIFSLGGFIDGYSNTTQRFDVFDVVTLKYTRLADLPGAPTHEAVTTDGQYIYAAGGQFGPEKSTDLTSAVWRYDIAKNKWQTFTKLPAVRTGGVLQFLNGKLHFIGGDDATRVNAQTTHWVLDLSNAKARWTIAAPLPSPADHAAGVTLNGVIYFIGGDNQHGTSYLSQTGLYAYDPARDKWVTFASLPTGISHAEAAAMTDGKNIFLVGGQGNAQQLTNNVYVYNTTKNIWNVSTPLPTARKGGVAWIRHQKIYYLTGDDTQFGLTAGGYVGLIGG